LADHEILAIRGEPIGVTWRSIKSPTATANSEASLQVVAAPLMEQVKAVADPSLSTVSVQLEPPPGAVVMRTWRSVTENTPGNGISTRPSLAETRDVPQATYESCALSLSAPPPDTTNAPCGADGPQGIGPLGVLIPQA
jgi:hypothetical protein